MPFTDVIDSKRAEVDLAREILINKTAELEELEARHSTGNYIVWRVDTVCRSRENSGHTVGYFSTEANALKNFGASRSLHPFSTAPITVASSPFWDFTVTREIVTDEALLQNIDGKFGHTEKMFRISFPDYETWGK